MNQSEAIQLYQPMLRSIALRMVGRLEDAEDIVQDTFEKWLSIDQKKIENTKAYLIRAVNNNCLQFLGSFKQKVAKKTASTEQHTDLVDDGQNRSLFSFDIETQVKEAWNVLHHKLEPLEKGIYVLREVFNVEYDELQDIFGKNAAHCRKLFSRAKAKIEADASTLKFEFPKTNLAEVFSKTCQMGQLTEIIAEFKNELIQKLPSKK